MPNNLKLSRATLAKFLPDHESIKAFEDLLTYANQIGPDGLADVLALVSGIRRVNVGAVNSRLDEIEGMAARPRHQNQVEQVPILPRQISLHTIESRLEALEQQAKRQTNLTALIRRIEQLEQITGV